MGTRGFEDIKSEAEALQKFGRKSQALPESQVTQALNVVFDRKGTPKKSKYRNVKVEVDGLVFDSKREYEHWLELKARESAGEIDSLRRQTAFDLYCIRPDGVRETVARYLSDFDYWCIPTRTEPARYVVEDTKSKATRTAVYMLKRKMFRALYGFDITEV